MLDSAQDGTHMLSCILLQVSINSMSHQREVLRLWLTATNTLRQYSKYKKNSGKAASYKNPGCNREFCRKHGTVIQHTAVNLRHQSSKYTPSPKRIYTDDW